MELLKMMKADKDMSELPVVMMSGLEGAELEQNCLELGANGLLKKPFEESTFREVMQVAGIEL
jgi:CheY-like chemotaxis protein